ncbi:hypothetical protein SAY87_017797 [Trapa incisa]|uniref:Core-2/I-branching beta-1,6-N-acetylglucosaminyltransferase family protein n=1 Tax=Trapa incisa TaxID=236973 RepID=A0AAN7L9L4_9MYRT|nr:hypothetical protein SAY87_017797 [Trapa incisa]
MTIMTNPGKPDRRPSFALFPRILLSMAPEKHPRIVKLLQALFILVVFVAGYVIGMTATSSSYISQYFGARSGNLVDSAPPHRRACGCDCHNTDCSSMDSYLHLRRNLSHGMSDGELLWRAAMVSRSENYPFGRVPRVAFLFLTRGPLPMLLLWERFFQGQNRDLHSIYVHALPGHRLNVSSDSSFHGRQIPSQSVEWGTVELFDAERRLLGNALLDFFNERFVLLSESCIPVRNFLTIYTYLTGSNHSFVESYDEPTRFGRGRYSRNMLPDIHLRQWRKGSQLFELDRDLATYIVSDTKYYSLFRKFCKPACYPDEHYIPTYLNMFHGWKNSNRSVTWVDWSTSASHPASFEKGNVTAYLIRSIRSNGTLCRYNDRKTDICYLFARKFAPSALGPLLELSSTVMGF